MCVTVSQTPYLPFLLEHLEPPQKVATTKSTMAQQIRKTQTQEPGVQHTAHNTVLCLSTTSYMSAGTNNRCTVTPTPYLSDHVELQKAAKTLPKTAPSIQKKQKRDPCVRHKELNHATWAGFWLLGKGMPLFRRLLWYLCVLLCVLLLKLWVRIGQRNMQE